MDHALEVFIWLVAIFSGFGLGLGILAFILYGSFKLAVRVFGDF